MILICATSQKLANQNGVSSSGGGLKETGAQTDCKETVYTEGLNKEFFEM